MENKNSPGYDPINFDKNLPDRTGMRWTKQEEDKMLEEIANGKTLEEIAVLHLRCIGGIESRLKIIAAKKFGGQMNQPSQGKESNRLNRLMWLDQRISVLENKEMYKDQKIAMLENKLKIAEYEIALFKAYSYIMASRQNSPNKG